MSRLRAALVLALLAAPASAAPAQGVTTSAGQAVSTRRCPMPNGLRIGITGVDTSGAGGSLFSSGATLDTTFRLDIAERTWRQPRMTASLEAGVGDTARARWWACTGVSISMQDVVLMMRQVRGQVRYRVDLSPLLAAGRRAAGTPQPR